VGQAGEQVNGIYETDYREFNRETWVRGRETFDRTWAEVKELIVGSWWRDMQAIKDEEEARDGQA
jgi:chromosome partitioning protein